jgi:ABC-type Fe3+-siderophore transport system permease subunit
MQVSRKRSKGVIMTEKEEQKKTGFMKRMYRFIQHLQNRIAMNRRRFILYSILRILVIVMMVRCFFLGEYENVALCVLSLVLFLVPALAEEGLNIRIPVLFESIIYIFIYAAWILGEIQNYYVLIPGWDTMLHTMNGFLCAAVGFSLVDLLNHKSKDVHLSPMYITIVAFCFSMTVGVMWEFIEYFCDSFFYLDMQKDTIIRNIGTVKLTGELQYIPNIEKTVMYLADGRTVTVNGGYLDVGINDTMKDLFVNLIGAIAFSIIGYNYIAKRPDTSIAPAFQIRYETPDEKQRIKEKLAAADSLSYREAFSRDARELFGRNTAARKAEEIREDSTAVKALAANEDLIESGASPDISVMNASAKTLSAVAESETDCTSVKAAAEAAEASSESTSARNAAEAGSDTQAGNTSAGDSAFDGGVRHLRYKTIITAWIGVLLAAAGFILLYPIGNYLLNIILIVTQAAQIGGLLVFLFTPGKKRTNGLWLFTFAAMTAAMLVVFKWMSQSEIYLAHVRVYLSTMAIAFALPIVLWKMYRDGDREYAAKQEAAMAGQAAKTKTVTQQCSPEDAAEYGKTADSRYEK